MADPCSTCDDSLPVARCAGCPRLELRADDDEAIVLEPVRELTPLEVRQALYEGFYEGFAQVVNEAVTRRIDATFAPIPRRPSFIRWLFS